VKELLGEISHTIRLQPNSNRLAVLGELQLGMDSAPCQLDWQEAKFDRPSCQTDSPTRYRGGAVLGVALKAWLTEGFAPRKFLEPVAFNAISLSLPAAGFVTGPRAEPSPAPQDLLRGAGNRVTTPPRSLVELAYRPSRQWAALAIEPLARAGGETGD